MNHRGSYVVLLTLLLSSGVFSDVEDELQEDFLAEYSTLWDYPTAEEDSVENLLLRSLNNGAIPDPLECTDLDPGKYFDVMNIEKKVIRICDLCPNLPFHKLSNVKFNQNPASTTYGQNYQSCLAECMSQVSCVAVSHNSGICSFYDNTEGSLVKSEDQELIIVTQPTGIIRDWVYSRNTISNFAAKVNISEPGQYATGPQILRSIQDSFPSCLSQCDVSPHCLSATYRISTRSCELLLNIDSPEPQISVDYKYGHLAALKVNRFVPARNSSWWRFQNPLANDGDLMKTFKKLFLYESNITAGENRTEYGEIPSLVCSINNSTLCKSDTTIECRFPENSGENRISLPICPESRHFKYQEIKSRMEALERCFSSCLGDALCIGVTYSPNRTACEALNINNQSIFNPPEIFFPLRMPAQNLNSTALKFSIFPGFAINDTGVTNAQAPNASACLELCQKSLKCQRFSYGIPTKQCVLAEKLTVLAANPNGLVFIQVPEISSPKIGFTRLISTEFVGRDALKSLKSSENLPRDSMELFVDGCLLECFNYTNSRCQFVRVEYEFSRSRTTCILYENGVLFPLEGAPGQTEVYVRNSQGNLNQTFSQANLDKIPFFGQNDFASCFRPKPSLSYGNLIGLNRRNESSVDANVATRFAYAKTSYARKIPVTLSEHQGKLKSSIFEPLGQALLDVTDEMVQSGKINNTLDRRPVVVKIWQSPNFDHIFQEIEILPFDRKPSPFRISRNASNSQSSLSSFGSAQSGVFSKPGKLNNSNVTEEFTSSAAKSIYDASINLIKFISRTRHEFSHLEKLMTEDFSFYTDQPSRKRRTYAGRNPCPVGSLINNVENLQMTDCPNNCVPQSIVNTFCEPAMCEPDENSQHTFHVSGYVQPKCKHCKIKQVHEISFYVARLTRTAENIVGPCRKSSEEETTEKEPSTDMEKFLPEFAGHIIDSNNFLPPSGGPGRWQQYDCKFSRDRSLISHQYEDPDYEGSTTGTFQKYDRGHLVPDADFIGRSGKVATYLYVNTAPQISKINQATWRGLEAKVRKELKVHHGVVVTGISINKLKCYPHFNVPVPQYFWKLVCFKREDETGELQTYTFGYMHENWYKEEETTTTASSWSRNLSEIYVGEPISLERDEQLNIIKKAYGLEGTSAQDKLKDIWESVITDTLLRNRDSDIPSWTECLNSNPDDSVQAKECIGGGSGSKDCRDTKAEHIKKKLKKSTSENSGFDETDSDESYEPEEDLETCESDSGYDSDFRRILQPTKYQGKVVTNTKDDDWSEKTDFGDGIFNSTDCLKRLVGYFNGSDVLNYSFTPVTGLALTHAIYSSLPIGEDGSIDYSRIKVGGSEEGAFGEFLYKIKLFPHINSMISIGESSKSSSIQFSLMASDPRRRLKFIHSLVEVIRVYDLDGVDLNWQQFYLQGSQNNDRENYVTLLRELRQVFKEIVKSEEYHKILRISIVGPSDVTQIDSGLDLPQLLKYADFVNVNNLIDKDLNTLPLYPQYPTKEYPGRAHADWILRYYTCKAKEFGPYKINMAVSFQDNPTQESLYDLQDRATYAKEKNLGGFTIWTIDKLKNRNYTQLEIIRDTNLCGLNVHERIYKCYDSEVQRWAPIGKEAPKCGKNAPTINGFAPVCNPYDPDFGCCGSNGTCGSGPNFCTCSTCVDYYNFPEKILS